VRGTSSYTDKHVFLTEDIFDTQQSVMMQTGVARISVPADTMHSFASSNNKIIWTLHFKGEIETLAGRARRIRTDGPAATGRTLSPQRRLPDGLAAN